MEIWLIYSLIAAIFTAATSITEKKTLLKEHAMEFSTVLSIIILIISIPLFFIIDYSKLQLIPIILLFFSAILGATGFLLVAKSVRHMEISNSAPLFALGPGIITLLAFIFLKETISRNQTIGIMLLITGAYILEIRENKSILEPIKTLKKSRYHQYIILALILYSITSLFDRAILSRYDMNPIAFIAFAHIFLAFNFIIMLHIFHDGIKGIKHGTKNAGWWILLIAIFVISYRITQAYAIKIANVGLVTAIKRTSTLLTVIIGGEIFREKGLFKKTIASSIMILGAILIVI